MCLSGAWMHPFRVCVADLDSETTSGVETALKDKSLQTLTTNVDGFTMKMVE